MRDDVTWSPHPWVAICARSLDQTRTLQPWMGIVAGSASRWERVPMDGIATGTRGGRFNRRSVTGSRLDWAMKVCQGTIERMTSGSSSVGWTTAAATRSAAGNAFQTSASSSWAAVASMDTSVGGWLVSTTSVPRDR